MTRQTPTARNASLGPRARARTHTAPAPSPSATAGDRPSASRLTRMLDAAGEDGLTVTFWSPSGLPAGVSRAVVRFHGRRCDVAGKPQAGDEFIRDEVLEGVPPGSGPFAVTTVARGVNPGTWAVTAELVPARGGAPSGRGRAMGKRHPLEPAAWSWRRWAVTSAPHRRFDTGMVAFARRPGIGIGVWPALVALGVLVALAVQATLADRVGLAAGAVLALSATGAAVGGVVAKVWYRVLERRTRRWNGWCIQGFVLGLMGVIVVGAPIAGVSLGTLVDVTTPALFTGMAIGRIGCVFAGCCGGRPTCSRLGLWLSDRRVGIRRVPTQLLESALDVVIAITTLVIVLAGRPKPAGLLFVAAVSAYTLVRQYILKFRAEARHTSVGSRLAGVVAAVALVLSSAALILA